MNPVRDDLLALSDFAWGRLRQRLDGLTDAEYHWEPVPHCRAVRRLDDGTYRSDGPVRSGRGRRSTVAREDTARFTTLIIASTLPLLGRTTGPEHARND